MVGFWYFVPKSGVAFIFLSVILIVVWTNYKNFLSHPSLWIFTAEIILFIICFLIANKESKKRNKKIVYYQFT
jgi:membrane protein DedA with SNARE-associated domain